MSMLEVISGERRWWVEHGDCLERLKLIPVSSDGEVDSVPLDEHVTWVAKRDDVSEEVCVVGVVERAYRLDVMNVWLARLWVTTAAAAFALVTFASLTSNAAPVGAVILGMPTTPSGIVLSFAEGIAARESAEAIAALALSSVILVVEGDAAVRACRWVEPTLSMWLVARIALGSRASLGVFVWFCYHAPRGPGRTASVMAGARTEDAVLHTLHLGWCASHLYSALSTWDFNSHESFHGIGRAQ